jgi:hypothetical protein
MNPQAIAIHFADEVSRTRALTDQETDMLCSVVVASRRLWSQSDDRELRRLRRKRLTAPAIAEVLNRSPMAVRTRLRDLKRKEA